MALTGGLRGDDRTESSSRCTRHGSRAREDRSGSAPADGARGYLAIAGGLVVETGARFGVDRPARRLRRPRRPSAAGRRPAGGRTDDRPTPPAGSATVDDRADPDRRRSAPRDDRSPRRGRGPWRSRRIAPVCGSTARASRAGEVPSMGLPLGAIQVPPDGRPIVMLADRPVTGGYRVPASVIRADIGRVAQLRTGDALTFASVTVEEAVECAAHGRSGAGEDRAARGGGGRRARLGRLARLSYARRPAAPAIDRDDDRRSGQRHRRVLRVARAKRAKGALELGRHR